jgi:4-cresol dehydrogenase (hydroxylating)
MALAQWRKAIGAEAVLNGADASVRYARDTSHLTRTIPAALYPKDTNQVQAVVRIAQLHGVPLYPISTGRNWGYGTALQASEGGVIVDLSCMNRIISLDSELGLVTLEPGVTQQHLRAYLDERKLNFMVPVTGGGPGCSLVGNALERGYGPAPYTDHFLAVTALEAVLPTGELYRSPILELGSPDTRAVFKWGIGPYLDGLFAQGNFGIVTNMTLALAHQPEQVCASFFLVERDEQLEQVVTALRALLRTAGSNVGAVNILSDLRMLATMGIPYPRSLATPGGGLPRPVIAELSRRAQVPAWMGVVPMYGTPAHIAATRALFDRVVGPCVQRVIHVDAGADDGTPQAQLDLIAGRPSELSLHMPYWKSGRKPKEGPMDPARDGCGLIWYTPVVPMQAQSVRRYLDLARRVCARYGIEAPVTLTGLSERAFDSSLALLFSPDDEQESARAEACYRALLAEGRAEGFVPYRVGSYFMPLIVTEAYTCWRMGSRLQEALDPGGILAPGRYALPRRVKSTKKQADE